MGKRLELSRIILFASLAILVLLVCMTRYADYDLWWHLRLGESIVSGSGIPWQDTFSYTANGRQQFVGEWLADSLIYLTFTSFGFTGLNLLKAVLVGVALCFIYRHIRSVAGDDARSRLAAVATVLLVLFAIRFRLFVRPYLFSLSFLAVFLYLLERFRSGERGREIFILPLLMLFWANMSVGAVFGIFAVGLATALEIACNRSWRLLPVLLLSLLASLANPETYRLYTLAIDLTSDPYRTLIGEYQPMTIDILFGSGLRYTICFQIIAAGGAVYFLLLRGWRNPLQLILYLFLLFESFRQVRLIELFSIAAAPAFAMLLTRVTTLFPEKWERYEKPGNYAVTLFILALIPLTVINSPVYAFGAGPKEGAFPEGALRFLQEHDVSGRMFNSYGFGGYLAWRDRERKVFIDGRYRRVYTPAEYGEYKAAIETAEGWNAAQARHHFDYAVLEYDLMSQRFPAHLVANPDWALVYWDNHSLIYVKRSPERESLIKRFEYRIARPTFLDLGYLDAYKGEKLNEALAGLEREVALNPDNQFVVLARVYLRYQLGKLYLAQIRADLERVLPIKPNFAMKHSALAMVLAAGGETGRAKREVEQALKLDPLDQAALSLAREMGMKVDIPKGRIPGHP